MRNRIVLASSLLIIGLAIGYLARAVDFQFISEIVDKIRKRFSGEFTPAPNFLTDVAVFEGVVIAIMVPLSFEMITRFSAGYNSDVFNWHFFDNWIIRTLPVFLLGNISLAITLRFFVSNSPSTGMWKLLAWMVFLGFIAMTILFSLYIRTFKRGLSPENVLNDLFDDAEQLLNQTI